MNNPEIVLVISLLIAGFLLIPLLISRTAFNRTIPIQELDQLLQQAENLRGLSIELQQALDNVDRIANLLRKASTDALVRYDDFAMRVSELSEKEKAIAADIDSLRQVPLPALDVFSSIMEKEGHSSAKRDYLLFGAGILFTLATMYLSSRLSF